MAGLTQKELLKKSLILLYEAGNCMNAAMSYEEPGTHRTFPLPETREHLRQVRRVQRELDNNWNCVWRHQW